MPRHCDTYTTSLGLTDDTDHIITLSGRVQTALKSLGSLQEIGPLSQAVVSEAIREHRCYVLKDEYRRLLGCAFIKQIDDSYYHQNEDFDITTFPKPWLFLHSLTLEPELQGLGIGTSFFRDVIKDLDSLGGTVLLDCWAGNSKLRSFYQRAGCRHVATLPENEYEIAVFVWLLKGGST